MTTSGILTFTLVTDQCNDGREIMDCELDVLELINFIPPSNQN